MEILEKALKEMNENRLAEKIQVLAELEDAFEEQEAKENAPNMTKSI